MSNNIVVIKTVAGEEIISSLDSLLDGRKVLTKPRVLQLMQHPSGIQVGFIPFIISNPDAKCELNDSYIATIVPATKEIEDAYLRNTSGIEIAQSLT